MFELKNYVEAESLESAFALLNKNPNNAILGGNQFLQLGNKRINTGIALSKLGLDTIEEDDDYVTLGSCVTFGDMERSDSVRDLADGVLLQGISSIVGTQFRNNVQVGASVYARYGFSDVIPILLALGSSVHLYHGGAIAMEDFLQRKRNRSEKDILTKVTIPKRNMHGTYRSLRFVQADFPILNLAMTKSGDSITLVIGARPLGAMIACRASEYMTKVGLNQASLNETYRLVIDEVPLFGNMRATKKYRTVALKGLLHDGMKEMLEICK